MEWRGTVKITKKVKRLQRMVRFLCCFEGDGEWVVVRKSIKRKPGLGKLTSAAPDVLPDLRRSRYVV